MQIIEITAFKLFVSSFKIPIRFKINIINWSYMYNELITRMKPKSLHLLFEKVGEKKKLQKAQTNSTTEPVGANTFVIISKIK